MGKKKKHKQKHDHAGKGASSQSGLPPQVAGVAAALSRHLSSPEGRHLLATGLTMAAAAASAALTRPAALGAQRPPEPPRPPVPPQPAAEASAPPPPPPSPPEPPQGTTKAPDAQVIANVIGDVADQIFGKLFAHRK